mmetsp:Transcript_20721/g.34143  ORF Transcript_20721/g.34143 Transcript_20721/m.34143 type:complete len:82 (+) Transcript_20721:2217-2462(+)
MSAYLFKGERPPKDVMILFSLSLFLTCSHVSPSVDSHELETSNFVASESYLKLRELQSVYTWAEMTILNELEARLSDLPET